MENKKKPEWFELADNDQPAKRIAKPSKSALAVVATLALTTLAGWGFITNDQSIANATESAGVNQISDLTPAAGSAASESTAPSDLHLSDTSPAATASTSASAVTSPSTSSSSAEIILPPSSKRGDDDGREHEKKSDSKNSEKSDNNHEQEDDD